MLILNTSIAFSLWKTKPNTIPLRKRGNYIKNLCAVNDYTDMNDQQDNNTSVNIYGVKSFSEVLPIRKIQIITFRMQRLRGFPLLV